MYRVVPQKKRENTVADINTTSQLNVNYISPTLQSCPAIRRRRRSISGVREHVDIRVTFTGDDSTALFDVDDAFSTDTYNTRSFKHIEKEVVGKNNHAVIWIVNHFST